MGRRRRRRGGTERRAAAVSEQIAASEDQVEQALSLDDACALLEQAEVVDCKGLPWGSNYTYAVGMNAGDNRVILGIYKPRRGEVPLWDFPDGTLYKRER